MLKMMRESFSHLKWILIAIVAIFILFIFVDWGAGGGNQAKGNTQGYAARVNGETISLREYDRALYYLQKSYEQQMRQPLTDEMMVSMGLKKRALDSLIDQHLLMQEARRLHLTATPDEVRNRILQIPTLNPDGKFVGPELYTRYVTGQLGFTSTAEFEDEIGDEITILKMESALTHGLVVSPKAALEEYRRVSENAKIRYVLYPASREAATTTVTPAEIEAYYRAHQTDYTHGEQRAIKYLIADTARLRLQFNPADADLQKRYEATKEDYKHPEQAHILHILIKVAPGAAPEVDAAAKAKADGIVKQLRAGADFAKLARESSADPSSSTRGGDMDFVDKGATVQPFDTAAFSIPINTISDPIRSQEFGYHIIKVLERRAEGYRSFAEVRPQLAAQMSDEQAKKAATDEIARISMRLKQTAPKNAADFTALASSNVTSNDTQWFGKTESIPGLGNSAQLSTWVFGAKVGDVGDITATPRGPMIPYLYSVRPAGVPPLAEIRAKVDNDARTAKARLAAQAALARALPAANIDEVAKKVGLTAADATVTRQGYVAGFTGDTSMLVSNAMAASIGELKGPIVVGDGAVAFQVTEQKKIDPKAADEGKTQYAEMLRQQEARNLRIVLLERLRKHSTVDINNTLLQNSKASQQAGA